MDQPRREPPCMNLSTSDMSDRRTSASDPRRIAELRPGTSTTTPRRPATMSMQHHHLQAPVTPITKLEIEDAHLCTGQQLRCDKSHAACTRPPLTAPCDPCVVRMCTPALHRRSQFPTLTIAWLHACGSAFHHRRSLASMGTNFDAASPSHPLGQHCCSLDVPTPGDELYWGGETAQAIQIATIRCLKEVI